MATLTAHNDTEITLDEILLLHGMAVGRIGLAKVYIYQDATGAGRIDKVHDGAAPLELGHGGIFADLPTATAKAAELYPYTVWHCPGFEHSKLSLPAARVYKLTYEGAELVQKLGVTFELTPSPRLRRLLLLAQRRLNRRARRLAIL